MAFLAAGLIQSVAAPGGGPPVLHEVAKLLASDGVATDWFGDPVAVSGDTVVVGAVGSALATGAAYVFERDAGDPDGWREMAKLTASDGEVGQLFGESVGISGDTLVVSGPHDSELGLNSGAAYVFQRDAGGPGRWGEVAKLLAPDGTGGDELGQSAAVADGTVVLGAVGDSDHGADSGSAYVFRRDAGGPGRWGAVAKLGAPDGAAGDEFGFSASISGDTAVIGAWAGVFPADRPGAAYVFESTAGGPDTWGFVAKLTASDGEVDDHFAVSVAIDGDTVVVGANRQGDNVGAAYVFERDAGGPGRWGEVAKLLASDGFGGDYFGGSVAISRDRVVVGASLDTDMGTQSGAAYVFARDAGGPGGWGEVAKLLPSDGANGDRFGYSVAISDDTVLAGAWQDDDLGEASGSAYVFSLKRCVLELGVDPPRVRPGDELRVRLYLRHERVETVTVPFVVWLEDDRGEFLAGRRTAPVTLEHGDAIHREMTLRIPAHADPGVHSVLVGIERMQQGVVGALRRFEVVE